MRVSTSQNPTIPSVSASRERRVHEIDLLRFLAAVAVVLFHFTFRGYTADNLSPVPFPALTPVTKYCWLGVELFFMISGFVILMTAGDGNLKRFIVSRAARLYPAFWVCCSLTALTALVLRDAQFMVPVKQFLANLTMVHGFLGIPDVDGAYWSLLVEIRFYLFVALIIAIRQIRRAEWFMVFWLVLAAVVELWWPVSRMKRLFLTENAAFFIAGATFYQVWANGWNLRRAALLLGSWGLALQSEILRLPALAEHHQTPMSAGIVAAVITGFYLLMLAVATGRTAWIGRWSWLLAGGMTYPLYLIHQNIGYMFFRRFWPEADATTLLAAALALVLLIAWLVHSFVEKPLSRAVKRGLTSFIDRICNAFTSAPALKPAPAIRTAGEAP